MVSRFCLVAMVLLMVGLSACSKREGGTPQVDAYTGDPVGDFVTAIHAGDSQKAGELIDSDPAMLELKDELGQTPMHYAALKNRPGIINLLVEKGMDPNVRDNEGQTALTVLEDAGLRLESAREALLKLGGTH